MTLTIQCQCGAELEIEEEHIGQIVECPACGAEMQIEVEKEPEAPAPGAPKAAKAPSGSGPKRSRPKSMDRARKRADRLKGKAGGEFDVEDAPKTIFKNPVFLVMMAIGFITLIAGLVVGNAHTSADVEKNFKRALNANEAYMELHKAKRADLKDDLKAVAKEAKDARDELENAKADLKDLIEKPGTNEEGDETRPYKELKKRIQGLNELMGEKIGLLQFCRMASWGSPISGQYAGSRRDIDEKTVEYFEFEIQKSQQKPIYLPFGNREEDYLATLNQVELDLAGRSRERKMNQIKKLNASIERYITGLQRTAPGQKKYEEYYQKYEQQLKNMPADVFDDQLTPERWTKYMADRALLNDVIAGYERDDDKTMLKHVNKLKEDWDRIFASETDANKAVLDKKRLDTQLARNKIVENTVNAEEVPEEISAVGKLGKDELLELRESIRKFCDKIEIQGVHTLRLHLNKEGAESVEAFYKERSKPAESKNEDYVLLWYLPVIKQDMVAEDGTVTGTALGADEYGAPFVCTTITDWVPEEMKMGVETFPESLLWLGGSTPGLCFALVEFVVDGETRGRILSLNYDPENITGRKMVVEYGGTRIFVIEKMKLGNDR